jgi:outer membrane protein OmpA-like peptidoglycan-associated protein
MPRAAEFELEGALLDRGNLSFQTEDEASELELVFTGTAMHPGSFEYELQTPICPTPRNVIVSGFPRYSLSVASLPAGERQKIRDIAAVILKSFQTAGCSPFLRVRVTGHADRDPVRELRDPGFMMRISRSRAGAAILELQRLIANRGPRIAWDRRGVADSALVVQNPKSEKDRAQNRRVVIEVSNSCSCSEFFEEYDRRSLPSQVTVNPTMTPGERTKRIDDVRVVIDDLRARLNARVVAALQGLIPSPAAVNNSSLASRAKNLSDAQIELFRQCLPDGTGSIDMGAFQRCFESFANGELRVAGQGGLREPDSAAYFLFAEFAFLCIGSNINAAHWSRLLKFFVQTQEIFMHAYRAGAHPAPPPVSAPVPSANCAPQRQLDAFHHTNFNAAGQSDSARKNALRNKYAPMDLNALRQAASENLRRALCMP